MIQKLDSGPVSLETRSARLHDGMLDFDGIDFRYEPYPIAYLRDVFDADFYSQLVNSWPKTELFKHMPALGEKYSLSEVNHPQQYLDFIRRQEPWRRLYEELKSHTFIRRLISLLSDHRIQLPIRNQAVEKAHAFSPAARKLSSRIKRWQRRLSNTECLRSRFEFSMMRGDAGCIKPHTDAAQKHITLVFSMSRPDEWQPEWGGGTSVMTPKDSRDNYNWMNRQLEFDDVNETHTYPFEPNQCVVFVKTFNSLHGVYPLKGSSNSWRKTLTINIENPK